MSDLMCNRKSLPIRVMQRTDADDYVSLISIENSRNVILERFVPENRSEAVCNHLHLHRRVPYRTLSQQSPRFLGHSVAGDEPWHASPLNQRFTSRCRARTCD